MSNAIVTVAITVSVLDNYLDCRPCHGSAQLFRQADCLPGRAWCPVYSRASALHGLLDPTCKRLQGTNSGNLPLVGKQSIQTHIR